MQILPIHKYKPTAPKTVILLTISIKLALKRLFLFVCLFETWVWSKIPVLPAGGAIRLHSASQ